MCAVPERELTQGRMPATDACMAPAHEDWRHDIEKEVVLMKEQVRTLQRERKEDRDAMQRDVARGGVWMARMVWGGISATVGGALVWVIKQL